MAKSQASKPPAPPNYNLATILDALRLDVESLSWRHRLYRSLFSEQIAFGKIATESGAANWFCLVADALLDSIVMAACRVMERNRDSRTKSLHHAVKLVPLNIAPYLRAALAKLHAEAMERMERTTAWRHEQVSHPNIHARITPSACACPSPDELDAVVGSIESLYRLLREIVGGDFHHGAEAAADETAIVLGQVALGVITTRTVNAASGHQRAESAAYALLKDAVRRAHVERSLADPVILRTFLP